MIKEQDSSFLQTGQSDCMLRKLKSMKSSDRRQVEQLWIEDEQRYSEDPADWARILTQEAQSRQGVPRGAVHAGISLLNDWGVDLSSCRLRLNDAEVEAIILGAPRDKVPGPDGIPSACLKVFARYLTPIFQEAWDELLLGQSSEHLGLRKWTIFPKEQGASTTAKMRDIEVCNEMRKVLARMLNVLLDEVGKDALGPAQQAFLSGRDIIVNNIRMHTTFGDWLQQHFDSDRAIMMLVLLDCSKGFNFLSWTWIERCLTKAHLPEPLRRMIMAMLQCEARLVLNGHEFGGLRFVAGLPQGCPLSCFVFILCVDPLLAAFSRARGVRAASGFVDDWAAALYANDWQTAMELLDELLQIVEEFERASGSKINRGKSALVPTRRLSDAEERDCRIRWSDLRISHRERLLGLYVGIDAKLDDQYCKPMAKFEKALDEFDARRSDMSLAVKIIAVNVFLYSLFGFVNRHFLMPQVLLDRVQSRVLRFLTPVTWAKLGLFCHLDALYGIRVRLQNLRFTNVSLMLASYRSQPEAMAAVTDSLQASLHRRHDGPPARSPRIDHRHPAVNYIGAYDFFRTFAGTFPETVAAVALVEGSWDLARTSLVAPFNRAMLARDRAGWRVYMQQRMSDRGWNADECLRNVRGLPSTIPQAHRWQLFRLHLNGIYTSARVGAAGVVDSVAPCFLCRSASDSVAHLFECSVVLGAWRQVLAERLADNHDLGYSMASLFFQSADGAAFRPLILAFFCATLSVRRQLQETGRHRGADVERLIRKVLQCPWVSACLQTLSRKERRDARVVPPLPARGRVLYRARGVAVRGRHAARSSPGWGAARWFADGNFCEEAGGRLDRRLSANVASYHALLACMARAWERRNIDRSVTFEMDSVVVARQMQPYGIGKFACRSSALEPLFLRCVDLGHRLDGAGVDWQVRHIFAEYNEIATAIAKEVVCHGSRDWHVSDRDVSH